MSLWLKKQQPIQLYQSSEIPYILLEDGVRLSHSNCFGVNVNKDDFNLSFSVQASRLNRINTYFYKFASFPVIIPLEEIISLDDTIVEGKTIKMATDRSDDSKSVCIMKSSYIHHIAGSDLSRINDVLEGYDDSFILVGETIDPQVRLFDDAAHIIVHTEWGRTLTAIAHKICPNLGRKYCWTQNIPELSFSCYGVDDTDELKDIHAIKDFIGMNASIEWAD